MIRDIASREDIDATMSLFYERAVVDDVIGYIFTDVAKLDLERHLPIIGDFWETVLFRSGNYSRHRRNPLEVHGELNKKEPLLPEHFQRWLEIFTETVDQNFSGDCADFWKMRAGAIAARMLDFVRVPPESPVSFQDGAAAAP